MKTTTQLYTLIAIGSAVLFADGASAQHGQYQEMIATHARANNVPEDLVHRVIVRESRYQPHLVGRGGAIGLMQIKLTTARALGYTGAAEGLRDPNTNLTYGVRYLAGAYRAANDDANRALRYYTGGYYHVVKRQHRHHGGREELARAGARPGPPLVIVPQQ